ncbi:hypothetical protein [Paenibacillus durus]|uniref:Phage head morphogenesis domain-containing protein n=2 Tax=Paenibacillus durus TaxID=44251 RepID=A0A0F7FCH7_PAEDU|nr:hypothetical protein [Paenibacillus durus]AKG36097.1 hypothetical protein VK70_17305 [Paenibacillus durus ATCC 35681]
MSKLQIKLPPAVRSFPLEDRRRIIESLSKALAVPPERPQGGRSMWDASDDPLIAALEDAFYAELDAIGQQMLASLLVLLDLPVDELQKGPGDKNRISDLVKKMRSKGGGWRRLLKYGVVDSPLQLIRKVDQKIRDQFQKVDKLAEKYIVRSGLLGIYRSQEEKAKLTITAAMLDQLPETLKAAKKEPFPFRLWTDEKQVEMVSLSPLEYQGLEQSVVHAAEKLSQIADNHRAGAKELIIQAQKERWGAQKLSQAFFDMYGDQNRDWRRVAITELAMATNDAYLASLSPGDIIQVATVPGACPHCQRLLEGKTFIVSDKPMTDGYKYIWPGKTNIGRKVAEWWPCCPLHPHCRHRWMRVGRVSKLPTKSENEAPTE